MPVNKHLLDYLKPKSQQIATIQQDATRVAKPMYYEKLKPIKNTFDPNRNYTKPDPSGSNTAIDSYDFEKYPFKYNIGAEGYGVIDPFYVDGTSNLIDKNKLRVSASVTKRPEYSNMKGVVNVTQNGGNFSTDTLKLHKDGYFREPSFSQPLGEGYVNLPDTGKYDVELSVFGEVNHGTGFTNRVTKAKLPYSK